MENKAVTISDEKLIEYLDLFGFSKIPENEKKQFIEICKMGNLNPFKREAHISAYGEGKYRVFAVITGYEKYIRVAEESGRLKGWKTPIISACKTAKTDLKGKISFIDDISAKIIIYREDFDEPFEHEVKFSEYVQKTKDGNVTKFWQNCESQLKKVAISQGFRLCFNDILKDLPYAREEFKGDYMDISEMQNGKSESKVDEIPTLNTPANVSKKVEPKEKLIVNSEKWTAAIDYISIAANTDIAFNKIAEKYEIDEGMKTELISQAIDLKLAKDSVKNE